MDDADVMHLLKVDQRLIDRTRIVRVAVAGARINPRLVGRLMRRRMVKRQAPPSGISANPRAGGRGRAVAAFEDGARLHLREFDLVKPIIVSTAEAVAKETGVTVPYIVGTMIELPGAALRAGEIGGCRCRAGAADQAVSGQLGEPGRIVHVGLAAGHVLHMRGVGQQQLEVAVREDMPDRFQSQAGSGGVTRVPLVPAPAVARIGLAMHKRTSPDFVGLFRARLPIYLSGHQGRLRSHGLTTRDRALKDRLARLFASIPVEVQSVRAYVVASNFVARHRRA